MNYHNITKDDMLNGTGLRAVLWLSGCEHHCVGCHNPETWDVNSGIPFDDAAKQELYSILSKDYMSGLTLTGGDPLHPHNLHDVFRIVSDVKRIFKDKTIWIYTGYTWEELISSNNIYILKILKCCDILVDGVFDKARSNIDYHWAGSDNQRVIDVSQSCQKGTLILAEYV